MFLVKSVVTLILSAILPHIVASSVHNSILELSLKVTTISPLEAAKATHFVASPLASVLGPVGPEVDSLSFLDSIFKVAVVIAAVAPDLDSLAVLLILGSDL